jgi:hypothetical protein
MIPTLPGLARGVHDGLLLPDTLCIPIERLPAKGDSTEEHDNSPPRENTATGLLRQSAAEDERRGP